VREGLRATTGRNVAVVVTDTAGRAWRQGQTDIAVGVAGLEPLASLAGEYDGHGNPLAVTAPAIGDELAGAADLVAGKLDGRPLVVVRGLASRVLRPGDHGPGAVSLLRPRGQDMFGLGAREAVLAAVRGVQGAAFGAPAAQEDLRRGLAECGWPTVIAGPDVLVEVDDDQRELARAVAFAHGWAPADVSGDRMVLRSSPASVEGTVTTGRPGPPPGDGPPAS
jgi:coenzyme F420-0:L-glutamate ligase/coenzyme F420-1:gamma-L-glutamate ligase